MNRTRLFAVATILLAMPLLAADLGKYKDWDQSPQGYFMTKAEHEQWKAVASHREKVWTGTPTFSRKTAPFDSRR